MNFSINNHFFYGQIDLSDKVEIKSYNKTYTVDYNNKTLTDLLEDNFHENDFIVIDRNVFNLDNSWFVNIDIKSYFILDAIEDNKNMDTVLQIVDMLICNKFNKNNKLLVIGGGITQDVGGFASAIYKRGINWVLIPTTLLSISDSCIGGKVGVNRTSKNILAMFCAPNKVIISSYFLSSLKQEDIISGIGEIVKLSLIGGESCYMDFQQAFKEKDYIKMIKLATSVKKLIIEYDELEKDERRVLNYGHTIGHALESATNYYIPHGIAVLYGMLIKNMLFYDDKYKEINDFILELIPDKFKNINVDYNVFLDNMLNDKKNQGNKVCFILLKNIGESIFVFKELVEINDKLNTIFETLFNKPI
jgi:3-dehydroquinate synthase